MTQHIKYLLYILLVGSTAFVNGQILDPVDWEIKLSKSGDSVGDEIEVRFTATIDPNWHLYTNVQEYEVGPLPADFKFVPNDSYELLGEVVPLHPKTEFDEVFEVNVHYFEHRGEFRQRIRILKPKLEIQGEVGYQVCTTVDGKCISGTESFALTDDFKRPDLKQNKQTTAGNKELGSNTMVSKEEISEMEGEMVDNIIPDTVRGNHSLASDQLEQPKRVEVSGNPTSLWAFMLLAFVSGFVALLTPCVFPMVPLTVSYFGGKEGGFGKALWYGFFIILIYVVAGTLVARLNGPEFANWLSTHWLPNLFFFVIFLVFAASFLGMFELTLPNSWINRMDRLSGKQGTLGVFFMAFTLVLVSFSCTGPIVGSVLVLSAGGEILKPVVGMFAFSLALALPFTLFAAFPKWLEKLPKSGGWLQEVKVVLGFLELALALKFLSIADQVYHWGILDRDIYLALWIVIFGLLGLYLIGKIRLPHDGDVRTTTVPKLLLAIVVFGFVAYLIPGMVGAPLKPLSGYLPPMTSQDFNLALNRPVSYGTEDSGGVDGMGDLKSFNDLGCPEPKYQDILKLPHGLRGYFDLDQAKECAQVQDKPIFVDFTGHGCVNCREMEAKVWSDPKVLDILGNDYVVLALYVDDKTELPESDWVTSLFDGKLKRTMGAKNADFQITTFNNNAQPFYVLLAPDGDLLVPPRAYDLDKGRFVEFLNSGLQRFKEGKDDQVGD